MNCPECSYTAYDETTPCPNCGFDLNNCAWVVIAEVSPPEDAIMESLIHSFGIPVRVIHSLGSVLGISVGPLGETKIAVPENCAAQAKNLLQAQPEEPQND